MVLIFESKSYESITQRIIFSIFKYGYIAHKYQLFFKAFYFIEIVIKCFFIFFLLGVCYDDLINDNIRLYGNMFNSSYNDAEFQYSNFDKKMSYFINFFDFITKMSVKVYLFVLVIFLLFLIGKISQFIYFIFPKVSVIKVSPIKKIFFYFFSFQDQLMSTFFDLLIITLSVSAFSCKETINVYYEIECYTKIHLGCAILSGVILFFTLIYILIQSFFYDPSNIIQKNNFGICDNIIPFLISKLQNISLAVCNLFFLIQTNQQVIKLCIHIGLSLAILYFIFTNQCKFSNFYQNSLIIETTMTGVFALVILLYVVFEAKITIFIFLSIIVCSLLLALLILFAFVREKTRGLYTNEENLESYHNMIYLLEMILKYSKNKLAKIVVNGFIQCYNLEYDDKTDILMNEKPKEEKNTRLTDAIEGKNVKYLLTMNNMIIVGSIREMFTKRNKNEEKSKPKSIKKKKLLEFVCDLIYKHSIKSHNFSFHFKMLTVQIYLRKLKNITRAWFILSNFYETFNKFSIRQQFFIFCMYQELHENLQKNDEKATHPTAKIRKIIKLEKSNNTFIKKVIKCTNAVKLFWLTYMNDKQKCRLLMKEMNKNLAKINRKYQKLQIFFGEIQKLFEDNRSIFYIYCCFLKNIMNNEQFSEHIIKLLRDNKAMTSDNKTLSDFIDEDYYKMSSSESIGLLIMSCNTLELGKIKWVNKKISNILHFNKNDLSKLKINRLLPPIIAQKHNELIKAFIQSNKGFYANLTRIAFMVTANDYMIPVVLYMNVFPRIKNGIEMIAMITRVINNTFILYKNPEIKTKTKLCFVLINEDGSIEAVDKNANTFLGIPNLIRNGWKTKITIDKRKCNLFELSPGLKKFIHENENNSSQKFVNECEIDTSPLTEEFANDEYGLFLSINNRINHMISKSIPIEKWIDSIDYYDFSTEQEDNSKENSNVSSSKLKLEYQNAIIPNIFKVHYLPHEIYNISSSNKDISLNLYLIKYYFNLSSFSYHPKEKTETEKKSNNAIVNITNNANISLGNITGTNIISGPNFSGGITQSKDTFAFAKTKFSRNDLLHSTKLSKKGSFLKPQTRLGVDMKKSTNTISSLLITNATPGQISASNNNNDFSNTSSMIKNTVTKFNITIEKLRLRKEVMIQEKITNQISSFKIIQILFSGIVIGLIMIISLEVYFRMKQINYLNPLHNLLFLFIYRRDLVSNLILNTLYHIEVENEIVNIDTYANYQMSIEKLINISKTDVISFKSFQDEIIDFSSTVDIGKIYGDNYTALYYEHDSMNNIKKEIMLVDSIFDLFISNFDKYFQYDSYKLERKERFLALFNPVEYLGGESFKQTELETRILNIFSNGINLIIHSEDKLITELNAYLIQSSNNDLHALLILGITAIVFTFIFSVSVIILFLKMINIQDELFFLFGQIDFICSIKVSVICDKFLKLLSYINASTSYSNDMLLNFYSIDHGRIYSMVAAMAPLPDKKPTSQGKASSVGLNNNSNSNINNSNNVNNSSDSFVSSNVKGKMSSSQSGAVNMGKRRNSDDEIIIRYKRYAEDTKKKRNNFLTNNENAQLLTEENEQNLGIKILKESTNVFKAVYILFFFIFILCGFFALLLVFDYNLNHYIKNMLGYLTFYQNRYYYSVNNLIWAEMVFITSTNKKFDAYYLEKFNDFLNKSLLNEERYHIYVVNQSYLHFDQRIQRFELESLCDLYTKTDSLFELSNNISRLSVDMCYDEESNVTELINKSLSEVVLYTSNFLRQKFNSYYLLDKTEDSILSFLNDDLLEYVWLLTQFVIRQSVFSISEMLNKNFSNKINQYSTLCIVLFIVFVAIIITVIFVANILAFCVFKNKQKRNMLLITLMPDEFIIRQIEEEEEEKERKKEIE